MDDIDQSHAGNQTRVRLMEELVGHLQFRRGQARMAGDEGAVWAFGKWLELFEGFLDEERQLLAALAQRP